MRAARGDSVAWLCRLVSVRAEVVSARVPHSLQNFASVPISAPQDVQSATAHPQVARARVQARIDGV
jgi:hypothetical protein